MYHRPRALTAVAVVGDSIAFTPIQTAAGCTVCARQAARATALILKTTGTGLVNTLDFTQGAASRFRHLYTSFAFCQHHSKQDIC